VPAVSADPERLAGEVARLGGFPVVVRFAGGSGGVGVVRCDSLPALASLVEWALSLGHRPDVLTYIAEGEVWRAIVVGDRCVAAYPNPVVEGDFRSGAPVDPTAYARPWPEGLDALALAAAVAVGARVAGVDVIALPTGRMYVLEANAPCYWGHAQEHGADVGGAIVELLLAVAVA
jgi:ribosomal protein S6--L-glutamate ligase